MKYQIMQVSISHDVFAFCLVCWKTDYSSLQEIPVSLWLFSWDIQNVKVYSFKNPEMFVHSVSIDWNYLLCYLEQTFVSVEERNLLNDNFNRNIRQRNIVTLEIFMMKVCLRDVTLIFLHYVLHLSAKTRILPQWEKACSALVKRQ